MPMMDGTGPWWLKGAGAGLGRTMGRGMGRGLGRGVGRAVTGPALGRSAALALLGLAASDLSRSDGVLRSMSRRMVSGKKQSTITGVQYEVLPPQNPEKG